MTRYHFKIRSDDRSEGTVQAYNTIDQARVAAIQYMAQLMQDDPDAFSRDELWYLDVDKETEERAFCIGYQFMMGPLGTLPELRRL